MHALMKYNFFHFQNNKYIYTSITRFKKILFFFLHATMSCRFSSKDYLSKDRMRFSNIVSMISMIVASLVSFILYNANIFFYSFHSHHISFLKKKKNVIHRRSIKISSLYKNKKKKITNNHVYQLIDYHIFFFYFNFVYNNRIAHMCVYIFCFSRMHSTHYPRITA